MQEFVHESYNKECKDQVETASRLSVLESQYEVVEKHTSTVSKLSTKVSLLLTILSFIVCIVAAGAIYTFTGISDFKVAYSQDRVNLVQQINEQQEKNRDLFTSSINALGNTFEIRMHDFENTVDKRFDGLEQKMTKLETKIELDEKKK